MGMKTMGNFIGEPKFFQDCQPADLIRIAHRDDSRFAFAVCRNASGVTDSVAILDEADGFPLVNLDGGEPIISYGRAYRISESLESEALLPAARFQVGQIRWTSSKGEHAANLMVSADGRSVYVDLDTGHIGSQRGGVGFNVVKWSVLLTAADGADGAEVFSAT